MCRGTRRKRSCVRGVVRYQKEEELGTVGAEALG
jgi:hypothetical protein